MSLVCTVVEFVYTFLTLTPFSEKTHSSPLCHRIESLGHSEEIGSFFFFKEFYYLKCQRVKVFINRDTRVTPIFQGNVRLLVHIDRTTILTLGRQTSDSIFFPIVHHIYV